MCYNEIMPLYLTPEEEDALELVLKEPTRTDAAAELIDDLIFSIVPSTSAVKGYTAPFKDVTGPGLVEGKGFLILSAAKTLGSVQVTVPEGTSYLNIGGAYILRVRPLLFDTPLKATALRWDGTDIESQAEGLIASAYIEFGGSHNQKTHGNSSGATTTRTLMGRKAKAADEEATKNGEIKKVAKKKQNAFVATAQILALTALYTAIYMALFLGLDALEGAATRSSNRSYDSGGYRYNRPGGSGGGGSRGANRGTAGATNHRDAERARVKKMAEDIRAKRRAESAKMGGTRKDRRSTGFRSENGGLSGNLPVPFGS